MITWEEMKVEFDKAYEMNQKITEALKKVGAGESDYQIANRYAKACGSILSDCYAADQPFAEDFDEGQCRALITGSLGNNYDLVNDVCKQVQTNLNAKAGIKIKVQIPTRDMDREEGMVSEVMQHIGHQDDIEDAFEDQLVNYSQGVVDNSIRDNADFQWKSGYEATVTRTPDAGACAWCMEQAGEYDYSEVRETGNSVWGRHENCNCLIEYTPRSGDSETVNNYRYSEKSKSRLSLSKETQEKLKSLNTGVSKAENQAKIAARIQFAGLNTAKKISVKTS